MITLKNKVVKTTMAVVASVSIALSVGTVPAQAASCSHSYVCTYKNYGVGGHNVKKTCRKCGYSFTTKSPHIWVKSGNIYICAYCSATKTK